MKIRSIISTIAIAILLCGCMSSAKSENDNSLYILEQEYNNLISAIDNTQKDLKLANEKTDKYKMLLDEKEGIVINLQEELKSTRNEIEQFKAMIDSCNIGQNNEVMELTSDFTKVIVNGCLIATIDVKMGEYTIFAHRAFIDEYGKEEQYGKYRIYCGDNTFIDEFGPIEYEDYDTFLNNNHLENYIALSGDWRANDISCSRVYNINNEVLENKILIESVYNLLNERGINNSPPIIEELYKTDINGDNKSDYIVRASNLVREQEKSKLYGRTNLKSDELKFTNNIGYYDMIYYIINDNIYLLKDDYSRFNKEELEEEHNYYTSDIGIKENIELKIGEPVYQLSKSGSITMFEPFTDGGLYSDFMENIYNIIDILDIDNDMLPELILECKTLYGGYSIFDFKENKVHEHYSEHWFH
ncbi:MAG: hypothetical protein N4A50_10155 [Vallitalea sp.]|nr:hypothetical protein [Vallitalea sp.]